MNKVVCLIALLIVLTSTSKVRSQNFENDFNRVAETFEKELKPYLLRFVQAQYPELPKTSEMQMRDQVLYDSYLQKAKLLTRDLKRGLMKDNAEATRKEIYDVFDIAYRMEFPGLDKQYFEKIRKSLSI